MMTLMMNEDLWPTHFEKRRLCKLLSSPPPLFCIESILYCAAFILIQFVQLAFLRLSPEPNKWN